MPDVARTILAITTSEGWGLGGSIVTTIGVAVTLWGTRTTRNAFDQIRRAILGPRPVSVTASPATISVTASILTPTVKASPGDDQEWSDEEWQTEFERRIDAIVARLDSHDHHRTEKSIKKLESEDERIRADVDSKLEALDDEAKEAERWNVAGLILVLIGAFLQVVALV